MVSKSNYRTVKYKNQKEIFLDVPGYEKLYKVSNLGRVKSLERLDRLNNKVKERFLKQDIDRYGYCKVRLYKNGIAKGCSVHRLVARAFLPNPENKPCVNHIDQNRQDNNVLNLEYVTWKENDNFGTRNKVIAAKMSRPILATNIETGEKIYLKSMAEGVRLFNFSQGNIYSCCRGLRNKHKGFKFKYA